MYSGGYISQDDYLWEQINEDRWRAEEARLVQRVNKSRKEGMTYIVCSYSERLKVAQMGANWDEDVRAWYIPAKKDVYPFFKKWKISCRYCNTTLDCAHVKDGEPCKYLKEGLCCGGLCYDPVKAPKFAKSVKERILEREGMRKN